MHPRGVDAEIAAALAAVRADVDAAAGDVGGDADDDIVGEAEVERRIARFDDAGRGVADEDGPATHRPRRGESTLEGLRRRHGDGHRRDVGIGRMLLGGDRRAAIGRRDRVLGFARRQRGDERRRIDGIGGDIVDRRARAADLRPLPRHVDDDKTEKDKRTGQRPASSAQCRAREEEAEGRDRSGGEREILRPGDHLE